LSSLSSLSMAYASETEFEQLLRALAHVENTPRDRQPPAAQNLESPPPMSMIDEMEMLAGFSPPAPAPPAASASASSSKKQLEEMAHLASPMALLAAPPKQVAEPSSWRSRQVKSPKRQKQEPASSSTARSSWQEGGDDGWREGGWDSSVWPAAENEKEATAEQAADNEEEAIAEKAAETQPAPTWKDLHGNWRSSERWRPRPGVVGEDGLPKGGRFGGSGGRQKMWFVGREAARRSGTLASYYRDHPKPASLQDMRRSGELS
jgi:hypothetical protein